MRIWQKVLASAVLAYGLVGGLAGEAHADVVTYTFGGTVMGSPSQFDSLFTAGASGQYVLTMDTSVANTCGGQYDGCWANAITYMSLSVGNIVLATANAGDVYVGNDNPWSSAPDIFQPYTTTGFVNAPVLGLQATSVQGNLWSTLGEPFTSINIPTTAFSLAPFNYLKGVYAGFQPTNCAANDWNCMYSVGQFSMSLDTLIVTQGPASSGEETPVPAPGALLLLALGLLGLRTVRRA